MSPVVECSEDWSPDFEYTENEDKGMLNDPASPTVSALVRATITEQNPDINPIPSLEAAHGSGVEAFSCNAQQQLLVPSLLANIRTPSFLSCSPFITSTPIMSANVTSPVSEQGRMVHVTPSPTPSDLLIGKEMERSVAIGLLLDISLDTPYFHTCLSFLESPNISNEEDASVAPSTRSRIITGVGFGLKSAANFDFATSALFPCVGSAMPDFLSDIEGGFNGFVNGMPVPLWPMSSAKDESGIFQSEIDPLGGLSAACLPDHSTTSPQLHSKSGTESSKTIEILTPPSDNLQPNPPHFSPIDSKQMIVRDAKDTKRRIERSAVLLDKNSRLSSPHLFSMPILGHLPSSPEKDIILGCSLPSEGNLQKLGLWTFKLNTDNDPRSPNLPVHEQLADLTHIPSYQFQVSHPIGTQIPTGAMVELPPTEYIVGEVLPSAVYKPTAPDQSSSTTSSSILHESKSAEGLGIGLPSDLRSQPSLSGDLSIASNNSWDHVSLSTLPTSEECMNLSALASSPPTDNTPTARPDLGTRRSSSSKLHFLKISKFAKRCLSTIPEQPTPSPTVSPKGTLPLPPRLSTVDPTDIKPCSSEDSEHRSPCSKSSRLSWFSSFRSRAFSSLWLRGKRKKQKSPVLDLNQAQVATSPTTSLPLSPTYDSANGSPGFIEHENIPPGLDMFKSMKSEAEAGRRTKTSSAWKLRVLF
ncbi:hypothetical protein CPC08DRAFT_324152 [Agrocybe pediades]|nr:hypothetical protein CPC08DRAFT_324152 [Agrocybe pediades]